jgi:pimeloyl-ACP methyl ester carboxylesterase/class 3 adenylate cyclase
VEPIRYAKNGDVHLAYRVVGEGDLDIVWVPGWVWDIELAWQVPGIDRFLDELTGLGRVITFDKRGTGQSDQAPEGDYPSFEERVGDVIAVMDAAGVEQGALIGFSEGGSQALLTAARHPERVSAVVSIDGWARLIAAEDDDPSLGVPEDRLRATMARAIEHWGVGKEVAIFVPSRRDDPLFIERWAHYTRRAASPRALEAYGRMLAELDIRDVLADVRAPTLLLHAEGDRVVDVEQSRYLARHLPDARLVVLPGADHLPFISHPELVLEEIQHHLLGRSQPAPVARRFAAVLLTDIVGSTGRAASMGDRAWRSLLDAYESAAVAAVGERGGQLVKSTGDGSLATFADPQAALLTARSLHQRVGQLGLHLRAGVHCGQVEVRGEDVGGIAVHITARVTAVAGPGETLVSSTVREVLLGSGFDFAPRGSHELKGVPGEWQLYGLEGLDAD